MNTVPSTTVAHEILNLAQHENIPVDPLKMMKLVYLCHGWSLSISSDNLINEEVEAWQYGPVISELYNRIRHFRASPITQVSCGAEILSQEQKQMIKSVFDVYKNYSGLQLSEMTHRPGTPWSEIWETRGKNSVIPSSLIRKHFYHLKAERA